MVSKRVRETEGYDEMTSLVADAVKYKPRHRVIRDPSKATLIPIAAVSNASFLFFGIDVQTDRDPKLNKEKDGNTDEEILKPFCFAAYASAAVEAH